MIFIQQIQSNHHYHHKDHGNLLQCTSAEVNFFCDFPDSGEEFSVSSNNSLNFVIDDISLPSINPSSNDNSIIDMTSFHQLKLQESSDDSDSLS